MSKRRLWFACIVSIVAVASCDSDLQRPDGPKRDLKKTPDGVVPDGPYPMGRRQAPLQTLERLAVRADGTLDFRWEDLPGQPAAVDLTIGEAGAPLFQIFASDGRPFARAGLRVVPLRPAVDYRLRLRPTHGELHLALIHLSSGQVVELGAVEAPPSDELGLSIGLTDVNKTRVRLSAASVALRGLTLAALQ